jgi:hypothetical protein
MALTGQPTEFQTPDEYKRSKGIPKENVGVQMDFWRGATHPAMLNGLNDGNIMSFYDAPMVVKNKNLTETVSIPAVPTPREQPSMQSSSQQGPLPLAAEASPCCGARFEQLNRTRVRCTSCGAEYQDNEAK